jgi:hypothetical protein
VPLEREVLTAMVQNSQIAQQAIERIPSDAFTHPAYGAVFTALRRLVEQGTTPDVRRLPPDDDTVTTTVSKLAVREMLPIENMTVDSMLERMLFEYERRKDGPWEPDIEDPLDREIAQKVYTQRNRERSRLMAKTQYEQKEAGEVTERSRPVTDPVPERIKRYSQKGKPPADA